MRMQFQGIVFFDVGCPFCRKWAVRLEQIDRRALFAFAPLGGKTAEAWGVRETRALVLLEKNGKLWVGARAILRLCWLLGFPWNLLGWLYLLPWGPNLLYRLIAHHRHKLAGEKELSPALKNRLLE